MNEKKDKITFSFGANWKDFLKSISAEKISSARTDIETWLGENNIKDKAILDIGCGSGIHSLVFYQLGAKQLISFDYDINSVEATKSLWEKAGKPAHWKVLHGSILDKNFISSHGKEAKFDIVYSWGVLHHTGAMWQAIETSSSLVKKGGKYWIALYVKGSGYQRDLTIKKRYNRASNLGKKLLVLLFIGKEIRRRFRILKSQLLQGKFSGLINPFAWNQTKDRGMDIYHDIIDWLGGLPYEVANVDEIIDFTRKKGFILEKILTLPEGNCNVYLFSLL